MTEFVPDDIFFIDKYHGLFPNVKDLNEANGTQTMNHDKWFLYHQYGFYTLYDYGNDIIVLYNFAIYPEYQRQGYGGKMLEFIINSYPTKTIVLFVEKDNNVALKLYKSHKFKNTKKFAWPKNQLCMMRDR